MQHRATFEPKWLVVAAFFLTGFFLGALGLLTWMFSGQNLFGLQKVHLEKSAYKFINPLLAVDRVEKKEFFVSKALESQLQGIIDRHKKQGDIRVASIYFRDLEPGRWVGINEELKFSPGILLKVPILISFFKKSETTPGLFDQMISLPQSTSTNEAFSPNLDPSQAAFTVRELLEAMIVNDDEKIAGLLFDHIDTNSLNEVYSDLGIDFHEDKVNEDFISTKTYALFFRILYNATYLNRDLSEQALSILSQTNNSQGILGGIPADVPAAHKYHSRSFVQQGVALLETHDCGIIYYPGHPYLLCTMSTGRQQTAVDQTLSDLSQSVYQDMQHRYQ